MRKDIATPDSYAVLWYTDSCMFCGDRLSPVIEFFASHGIPLVVRKPVDDEILSIPAYPALYVPKAFVRPVMLVGTGMLDVLVKEPKLAEYYGPSLDYLEEPAKRRDAASVQRGSSGDSRHSTVQLEPGSRLRVLTRGDVAVGQRDPERSGGSDN